MDRPVLEYGNVLWDNITHNKKYELDITRKKAARIVTVTTKLVSMQSLNKHTKWENLRGEEKKSKLTLFYNMVNGLSPSYLSSLVPLSV